MDYGQKAYDNPGVGVQVGSDGFTADIVRYASATLSFTSSTVYSCIEALTQGDFLWILNQIYYCHLSRSCRCSILHPDGTLVYPTYFGEPRSSHPTSAEARQCTPESRSNARQEYASMFPTLQHISA